MPPNKTTVSKAKEFVQLHAEELIGCIEPLESPALNYGESIIAEAILKGELYYLISSNYNVNYNRYVEHSSKVDAPLIPQWEKRTCYQRELSVKQFVTFLLARQTRLRQTAAESGFGRRMKRKSQEMPQRMPRSSERKAQLRRANLPIEITWQSMKRMFLLLALLAYDSALSNVEQTSVSLSNSTIRVQDNDHKIRPKHEAQVGYELEDIPSNEEDRSQVYHDAHLKAKKRGFFYQFRRHQGTE